MAVVIYQCTVCKREIELIRNKRGLETVGPCTITHGCRGRLHQQDVRLDFVRGRQVPDVVGLENWRQRKMLYNHTQVLEQQTWVIKHSLGTFPSVQVFVKRPLSENQENLEEITPKDVWIVDDNTLEVVFEKVESGVAQVLARSSDPDLIQPRIQPEFAPPIEKMQLTNSGEITVAVKADIIGNINDPISFTMQYRTADGSLIEQDYVADSTPSILSPWRDKDTIVIKGKSYNVRSFQLINQLMVEGTVITGSTMEFKRIDPVENMNISIDSVDLSTNELVFVDTTQISNHTPYFRPDTIFLIDGSTLNRGVWVVESSNYDLITHETRVKVTEPLNDNLLGVVRSTGSRDIARNEVLVLLATGGQFYDKVENKFIDVKSAVGLSAFFYDSGEFFAFGDVIQTVYPPIRSLSR